MLIGLTRMSRKLNHKHVLLIMCFFTFIVGIRISLAPVISLPEIQLPMQFDDAAPPTISNPKVEGDAYRVPPLITNPKAEGDIGRHPPLIINPKAEGDAGQQSPSIINAEAEGGCPSWINLLKKRVEEYPEPTKLTKKIFISWQQGFGKAPEIVQMTLNSWIVNNPTWEVIQVTNDNVKTLLEGTSFMALFESKLSMNDQSTRAAYSDIIRMFLLEKYGGVWADATTLSAVLLDSWLPFVVDKELDFFAFRAPAYSPAMKKEHYPLSSWFLYGTPESPIIQKWKEELVSYWDGRTKAHAYFWFHYNLFHVFKKDKDLANKWIETSVLLRDAPHEWQDNGHKLIGRSCSGFLGAAPVLKLTHYANPEKYVGYLKATEENNCGFCEDSADCEKDSKEMFESLRTWCKA